MKRLFSGILLLMSLTLCAQDFKKLDEKNIDSRQKEFARKFAGDYFSMQTAGGSYQFKKEEATDEIIKFLTPEKQKEVYSQLKSAFGDYKSLVYSQTWMENNSKVTIYRFKSLFGDSQMEIRVVVNDKGKSAGFFIKPWADNLQ